MGKLTQIPIGDYFNSPFGKTGGSTLGDFVSILVTASFSIASIVLLFYLVIGGLFIISGAGQDNPERVAKGRQSATTAAIGFVIVFVAYWIIRVIEVITGFDFITAPGI
jgi:hypothetical protein